MNFSIEKDLFSELLYLTTTIVEKKNTMPILANVKLGTVGNQIEVSATDLQVSLVGKADADIVSEGQVTVDAKVLYDIVKELPAQTVYLETTDASRIEIKGGQAKFHINCASSDEFPAVGGVQLEHPMEIDPIKFHEMFDKTFFSISTDETRYNMTGICLDLVTEQEPSVLRFVATDGHRLALIDRPAEGFSIQKPVIIPKKGIQELKKVLEHPQGESYVSVSDEFFTVQNGPVTLGVRLTDAQYPEYQQVIPTTSTTSVHVPRNNLLAAIKRVSIVTTDKTKAVMCELQSGTLRLTCSSPQYGEASESIEVTQVGEDVSVAFSAKYVNDILNAMNKSDEITIELNGSDGAGVFRGSGDDLYRCIVMPMRYGS